MAITEATRPTSSVQQAPALSSWPLALGHTNLKTKNYPNTSAPPRFRGEIGGRP